MDHDSNLDHRAHPQTETAQHSRAVVSESSGAAGVGALSLQRLQAGHFNGRGNGPVRTAMIQRMQQTLGNRRVVAAQRSAAPSPTLPVQRDWMSGGAVGAVIGGVVGGVPGAVAGGLIGAGLGALFDSLGNDKSYGTWKLAQTVNSAAAKGGHYSSPVTITFSPNAKTVDSTEIAFVQKVQLVDTGTTNSRDWDPTNQKRMTKDGSSIDRVPGRKDGFYGYNNDGKPSGTITPGSAPTPLKDATLLDTPQASIASTTWSFETAAIAKAGKDTGKIYGALSWGFTVDADNKLTAHKEKSNVNVSADFNDAVKAWNAQAKGPEADRNHKDQAELGPFN